MGYLQLRTLSMEESTIIIHRSIADGYAQDVVHCQYSVVESEVIFQKQTIYLND